MIGLFMVMIVTILKGNSFYGWPKNINVIDHKTWSNESHICQPWVNLVLLFFSWEKWTYIYIYFGGAFDQNPMMPYFSIHSSIAPLDTSQNPPHTFSILVFLWVSCTVPKSIFSLFQIPRSQNLQVLLNMWRFTYIKHLEKGPILSLWALLGKRTHAPLWNALWVFTLCNVRSKYIRKIWGGLYVFGIVIDEKTTSTIFLNSHFMVFMHPFSLNRAAG